MKRRSEILARLMRRRAELETRRRRSLAWRSNRGLRWGRGGGVKLEPEGAFFDPDARLERRGLLASVMALVALVGFRRRRGPVKV